MPIRSLATYIRSARATALNTLVSLMRKMAFAPMAGIAVASAWGRITKRRFCSVVSPTHMPASTWAASTASRPLRSASAM